MTPGRLDLEVPRNGSDARILQLFATDEDGVEAAIDITGFSFSVQARDAFGGDVIATASVTVIEATEGKIQVEWLGSAFDAFGDIFATAVAAWDLKQVDASAKPTVPVRGLIYITPEATA
jgi:hypothetical protein